MPDVIVAGGGVIGAACALELARGGASVTLLERSELAAGASGRNHGLLFTPSTPELVPLFRRSLEMYRELNADAEVPFLVDDGPLGLLVAWDSDASRDGAELEGRHAAAAGVRVEGVGPEDLRRLEPNLSDAFAGAVLIHDGFRLDPAMLTIALARAAASHGAQVRTGVGVKGVLVRDGRVQGVATEDGLVPGGAVLLAAGPWTGPLAARIGVRLPVYGARGWIVHLGPAPSLIGHIVEYGGWHLAPGEVQPVAPRLADLARGPLQGDANVVVHPVPGDGYLLGGSRVASIWDEPESPEVVNDLACKAIRMFPVLADVGVLRAWSGVRPMSPDGLPMIGRLPIEGLWVATGHAQQGVILAGGTGTLFAQLFAGGTPEGAAAFDPARF